MQLVTHLRQSFGGQAGPLFSRNFRKTRLRGRVEAFRRTPGPSHQLADEPFENERLHLRFQPPAGWHLANGGCVEGDYHHVVKANAGPVAKLKASVALADLYMQDHKEGKVLELLNWAAHLTKSPPDWRDHIQQKIDRIGRAATSTGGR